MSKENLTDQEILELLEIPKRVTNPRSRKKELERHEQWDYEAESDTLPVKRFAIFLRQSTRLKSSFSVGLRLLSSDTHVTLIRCNGSSHPHKNHIEKERFEAQCHVHIATERYLSIGRKDEGFAEPTDEYNDMRGALMYLMQRCNISNLPLPKNGSTDLQTLDDLPNPQSSLFT